ncbi:MAG TPA: chromate transporter, partial [Acidimicrobiales bacterium]
AVLAAALAFGPSFLFIIVGAPRFTALRVNRSVISFLRGAGPCVIGAIAGSSIVLGRSLTQPWQFALLLVALLWFFVLKRGVVPLLLLCGAVGVVLAMTGIAL